MPQEAYAEGLQLKEIRFTHNELVQLLVENIKARTGTPYDFDYDNPIVSPTHGIALRFFQKQCNFNNPSNLHLKPIPKL